MPLIELLDPTSAPRVKELPLARRLGSRAGKKIGFLSNGKANVNSRYNAFGQGWRANATIGRAIRLVLLNVGGGTPGVLDRATQGQPSKYSYCVGENELENPWSPLHVEHCLEYQLRRTPPVSQRELHALRDRRA
jgi:hypothetical protein